MDAVKALRLRRQELAQRFTRLLDAIEQELLNRRSAQQPLDELTREAAHLLHNNQQGVFLGLRPQELVEEVTYAHELLRRLGAQQRRAEELDDTQRALETLEAARRAAGAEGAQAPDELAHHRDPWLGACALFCAGSLGARDLAPVAQAALADPDALVRETALAACRALLDPPVFQAIALTLAAAAPGSLPTQYARAVLQAQEAV